MRFSSSHRPCSRPGPRTLARLVLACAAMFLAHPDAALAQCDPVDGGVIAPVESELCGREGRFTILSQSDGSLGTSVFGGGVPTGGSTGGSCSLLGCLVAGAGTGGGCTYGYSWQKSVDGGPFTEYIPFSGTKQLAPSDSTGFSNSGYRIFSYRRFLESTSGASPVSSNVVVLTQYASWTGGIVGWNPDPALNSLDRTIACGATAPAIFEETGSPARFPQNPSGSPTPPFEHKWQAFYGGAWRDINYTVNGTFFPQGRPDLDATLVNSEFNAHAELVGQEYVLKFRRLARPAGKCEFHPAEFDVTLRRPLSTPVVTTTADSQVGSLRNAVTLACAEDIVTFSPSLGGSTITLSSAITIPRNLTIKGDGANRITISGNGTTRAFVVPAGTNATLSSLDIVGVRVPSSSGAIFSQGNLSLRDMTFRDGQGGVTSFPGSTLRVVDSAFHGNDTLPPDRTVRFGGAGISAFGSVSQPTRVEVINSTFSGNHTGGGAIACQGCDLVLRNSTLTNNLSDGFAGGLVTNTDGSGKNPSVVLSGTIIAGNTATLGGPDINSFSATFTSEGHNLIGSNQDAFSFQPVGTDKVGTQQLPLAPKLSPLANNGGFTRTHALACASPAFDAGNPTDGSADQIGQRTFSSRRDIGAFESQQPLAQVASGFRSEADAANPLLVNFTDLSTGLPTSWSWDFGDGATSTLQSPTHTYTAPGRYAACLTASSACGSTAAQCDAEVLSADVPKPVLDNQTITSKLVIDSLANVGDMRVRVDVKHTFRGDVRLTLISPSGTRVLLKQTDGNSADDIVGTYGADLKSAQPLTLFEGEPADGTWTLEAFDAFPGDTGRIAAWGLALCEARDCVKADATGLPVSGTLATPATSTLQMPSGPPIDRLRVRVDVSALQPNGQGTSTSVLKLELRSPSGTRITLSDGGPGPAQLPIRLTGTFGVDLTSLQTLDAFQGQSPAGAWDLIVSTRPFFPTYGSRIDAWSLQACAAGEVEKCRPVTLCGSGFVSDGAGGCVDFDECVPFFNACSAGSTCTNLPGGFTCDTVCVDDDNDALCATADNCPAIFNPDQENFDADALGDVCDPDANGDDVLDATAVETINNGGSPPTAANVIDAGDGIRFSHVEVRNVGCGPGSCPMPWGAQTQATLAAGGKIVGDLRARESSIVRMSGGSVGGSLVADDASRIELTGGAVALDLLSLGFGSIEMRGGSVGRDLIATAGSNIKIVGTGFAVDGVPVGPGPIAAQTGVLTGELAFGETINNRFCHNGCTLFPFAATGVITLEEPLVDADGDGIADGTDNCTQKANPAQVDADDDGFGNDCDADFNNDGIVNFIDLAAMKAAFFTNDPVVDLNADGFVNFLDLSIMKQSFFQPPGPSAPQP